MKALESIPMPALATTAARPVHDRLEALRAERRARRPAELVRACGWPQRAISEAERADESKPCIQAVRDWRPEPSACILVLSGGRGAGKTVAVAWWALRQTVPVEFVTAESYVTASAYDGARDRWRNAAALVLDDLGVEYQDAKGASASAMDALVDEFYSHQRPLLITTNLDAPAFKSRVGERIADRVRECQGWRAFTNAPSLRGGR